MTSMQDYADDVAGIVTNRLRKEKGTNVYWCMSRLVGNSIEFSIGSYNTGFSFTVEPPTQSDLARSRTELWKMAERTANSLRAQYDAHVAQWLEQMGLKSDAGAQGK